MHLPHCSVSKSSITFLTTTCHSEARRSGCALTDWPYAQVSYIPFNQSNPEYLHPVGVARERPFSTDSLDVAQGSLFCHDCGLGVECLHGCYVDDATALYFRAPCVKPDVAQECKEWGLFSPIYVMYMCLRMWLTDSYGNVWEGPHLRPGYYKGCEGWGEIFNVEWLENVCQCAHGYLVHV